MSDFIFERIGEKREAYLDVVGRDSFSIIDTAYELNEHTTEYEGESPRLTLFESTNENVRSLSYRSKPRTIKARERARAIRRKRIAKQERGW